MVREVARKKAYRQDTVASASEFFCASQMGATLPNQKKDSSSDGRQGNPLTTTVFPPDTPPWWVKIYKLFDDKTQCIIFHSKDKHH